MSDTKTHDATFALGPSAATLSVFEQHNNIHQPPTLPLQYGLGHDRSQEFGGDASSGGPHSNILPQFSDLQSLTHGGLPGFHSSDLIMINALHPDSSWVRDSASQSFGVGDAAVSGTVSSHLADTDRHSGLWLHTTLPPSSHVNVEHSFYDDNVNTLHSPSSDQMSSGTSSSVPMTPMSPTTPGMDRLGGATDSNGNNNNNGGKARKGQARKREHLPILQRKSTAMVEACERGIRRAKELELEIQRLRDTLEAEYGWNMADSGADSAANSAINAATAGNNTYSFQQKRSRGNFMSMLGGGGGVMGGVGDDDAAIYQSFTDYTSRGLSTGRRRSLK